MDICPDVAEIILSYSCLDYWDNIILVNKAFYKASRRHHLFEKYKQYKRNLSKSRQGYLSEICENEFTPYIVKSGVAYNGQNLLYVPDKFQDLSLIKLACLDDTTNIYHASKNLEIPESYLKSLIERNPKSINFMWTRQTPNLCYKAIKMDPFLLSSMRFQTMDMALYCLRKGVSINSVNSELLEQMRDPTLML